MKALQQVSQALVERDERANAALVYVASLNSAEGRRVMRAALEKTARLVSNGALGVESFPWHGLRFAHVQALRAKLSETLAPATVNRYLCAVRGVLRAAWLLGQVSADDYHAACAVRGVRAETLPAGRSLTSGEIAALMATCANDDTPAGVRDGAIVALAYAAGLRRAEIASLHVSDYTVATGELRVRGKGNKERVAWLNNGAAMALADWLAVRGDGDGPLFTRINKAGRISADGLTPQAVYNILAKRATEAGVVHLSPHDLRRTFVSDLLDAGADIATVAKMAGHANVQTTARYDRRPEEAKRRAAGLLHVPYYHGTGAVHVSFKKGEGRWTNTD